MAAPTLTFVGGQAPEDTVTESDMEKSSQIEVPKDDDDPEEEFSQISFGNNSVKSCSISDTTIPSKSVIRKREAKAKAKTEEKSLQCNITPSTMIQSNEMNIITS